MAPWQVLEHTADVGLRATGPTLAQALQELVAGLSHLLCPDGVIEPREEREVVIEGAGLTDVVVDLLDELNFLVQTDDFLPRRAAIELAPDGTRLVAKVEGEAYDAERHGYLMEIKATTYHELKVEESPALIEVLFDI